MSACLTLEPGRNCWKVELASRVAPLVDAEAYFSVVRRAMGRAQRRIYIAGWDVDSRVELDREADPNALPTRLGELLGTLGSRNSELDVYVLAWDFSPIYLLEREILAAMRFRQQTHGRIRFVLDDRHAPGASQHEKLVVIDDEVGFCGGLDLCDVRWDTPAHRVPDPRRVDVRGRPYRPHHDVQIVVEGPAAALLAREFRDRWRRATGETLDAIENSGRHVWPPELEPMFSDIPVGIARTRWGHADEAVHEVQTLWVDAVAAARRSVYLETCYLTDPTVVDALAARLDEAEGPTVTIVTPSRYGGWLEDHTMAVLRDRRIRQLREADGHARLVVLAPHVRDADTGEWVPVSVHSKILIIDDEVLRIGSSNVTRRSMALDTECDVIVVARTAAERAAIDDFHASLLAEHFGCDDTKPVESLAAAPSDRRRICCALQTMRRGVADRLVEGGGIADPGSPLPPSKIWRLVLQSTRGKQIWRKVALVWWVVVAAGVIVVAASGTVGIADLVAWVSTRGDSPWAALATLLAFVLGGLVLVPVTLMIFTTGVAFGPVEGLAVALCGAFASAAVYYWLGRWIGHDVVFRFAGPRIRGATRAVARRGLFAVAVIRLVPLTPHVVVGLAAGAARISFRDYMIGTIVAMAPGIAILVLLGRQLAVGLGSRSLGAVGVAAALLVVGLGVSWLLQRWIGAGARLHEPDPVAPRGSGPVGEVVEP